MRVFVTGGAGYIGSHTCKALAEQGHQVAVYDNLSTGFRNLVRWGDFFHGDIRHVHNLRSALQAFKPDGVIHFASSIAVGESVENPALYYENNVTGSLCLMQALCAENISHVVVSGTAAVYGLPTTVPVAETSDLMPINPYGRTKLIMEWMLEDMQRAHGLSWVSLRYFNAAGADPDGQTGECHDPETHLIPNVLRAISGDIPAMRLFGDDYDTKDGTCIRDYIHVSDLAAAHILALKHLTQGGQSLAMNLGNGKGISVRDILNAAQKVTGIAVPHTIEPRRVGDPAQLVADANLAQKILGWQPRFTEVEDMVESAWKWHTRNSR